MPRHTQIHKFGVVPNTEKPVAPTFFDIERRNWEKLDLLLTSSGVDLLNNLSGIINLVGGPNITINPRPDNNTIEISGVSSISAPTDATYVVLSTNPTLTDERVLTAGPFINIQDTGAGGLVIISGIGVQTLNNLSGMPSVIAGPGITITLRSDNNTIEISGTSTPTIDAPSDASYVVLSGNTTLSNERVLTAGPYINIQDNGANSTVVISGTGVQLLNNMSGLVSLVAGPNINIDNRKADNIIIISGLATPQIPYDPVKDPLLLAITGGL